MPTSVVGTVRRENTRSGRLRIGLGTAQFGFPYGITNTYGKPTSDEIRQMLEYAGGHGISLLDTAPAYGDSERLLGELLPPGPRFRVVTKTQVGVGAAIDAPYLRQVRDTFRQSLRQLRRDSVYGLLVHHGTDLLKPGAERLFDLMLQFRDSGEAEKIGVSVYDGEEIDRVTARYPVDLIEVPLSIFDQRLIESGHLGMLKKRGVEIHARSVFLQGILLVDPTELPAGLARARQPLHEFRQAAHAAGLSPIEAALGFVLSVEEVDVALCGVTSLTQLVDLISASQANVTTPSWRQFAIHDVQILNPSLWSSK